MDTQRKNKIRHQNKAKLTALQGRGLTVEHAGFPAFGNVFQNLRQGIGKLNGRYSG
jgi:hypothetical protein